jgi:hypothetical protein
MRYHKAPQVACLTITIFPPPIECLLSAGRTELAFDLGGSAEFHSSRRTVVRMDLGDTIIRHGGPVMIRSSAHTNGLTTHNLQLNLGLSLRF